MRNEKGQFVKGHRPSQNTEFKKGEHVGNKHPNWKGGRCKDKAGYVLIYMPNHPNYKNIYVREHILVVEKKLGRYLKRGEIVHHINGIKDDNKEDNLVITTVKKHGAFHRKLKYFYSKDNFPLPKKNSGIIVLRHKVKKCRRNDVKYEAANCIDCGNIFWKNIGKKVKGLCSKCNSKRIIKLNIKRSNKMIIKCLNCYKDVRVFKSTVEKKKFCSRSCYFEYYRKKIKRKG